MSVDSSEKAKWLLLLPRPSTESTLHSLKVAYGPSLEAAFRDASRQTSITRAVTVLDIGLACNSPWMLSISKLNELFGLLYKLSCMICVDLQIDILYDNDVDYRFFLFAKDFSDQRARPENTAAALRSDLKKVAQCSRSWTRVCSVQSEVGEDLLQQFLHYRGELGGKPVPKLEISRLPGGISNVLSKDESSSNAEPPPEPTKQHFSVAVGGTFDHLHAGHKLLLTMTALLCISNLGKDKDYPRCLTIGITGDTLLEKKAYKDHMENWHLRQRSVASFLTNFLLLSAPHHNLSGVKDSTSSSGRKIVALFNAQLEIRYVEIFDPFGPTITDPDITALVISAETRSGGEAVNEKRQGKEWQTLEVFEIGVLDAEDETATGNSEDRPENFQNKLSSTQIRSRIQLKLAREH